MLLSSSVLKRTQRVEVRGSQRSPTAGIGFQKERLCISHLVLQSEDGAQRSETSKPFSLELRVGVRSWKVAEDLELALLGAELERTCV